MPTMAASSFEGVMALCPLAGNGAEAGSCIGSCAELAVGAGLGAGSTLGVVAALEIPFAIS